MKLRSILTALLFMAVLQTVMAQKLVLHLTGNQAVEYNISQLDSISFIEGTTETHEYVDLGLPSGTLWATCNVGANSPEEYGDYFAWGETEPKNYYSYFLDYKYCRGSHDTMTKYCVSSDYGTVDNKTELETIDDAATANWGNDWQIPHKEQYSELFNSNYTTTAWTTMNGVYGRKITSKNNGNSIFLPAAGSRDGASLYHAGSYGYYWSRSLSMDYSYHAHGLCFYSDHFSTTYSCARSVGHSVRPVRVKKVVAVTNIKLNQTKFTIKVAETLQLSATILPTNATNKTVVWSSSNTNVAIVNQTGKVTSVTGGTCTIICSAADGSGVKAECKVTVQNETHEWVDLGLPSGTLWATCNVGASSLEEYGDYFAWGETKPKSDYSWSTYKYCKGTDDTMTKYCTKSSYGTVDNKTELEPSDDAATVNWGSNWQMPSIEQCEELINSSYTTTTWTTLNGVNGRMIVSKSNGNRIFLPAAGYRYAASLNSAGIYGDYWSRSLYSSYSSRADVLHFYSSNVYASYGYRYYGQSVRPVRVNGVQTGAVLIIELSQTVLSVMVGETSQLSATVLPGNATNKNLKWESCDTDVATVDQSGKVTSVAVGTCTITCSATDGSGVKAECNVTVKNDISGTLGGHDYVDLGLPSGTLWATCNVGANSPEEYGDYFAWGETEPKTTYYWDTYKYFKGTDDSLTKYCTYSECGTVDNKIELEPSDDAATVNWGSGWQMPSREQFDELIHGKYTITTYTSMNGEYGRKITSKSNGNSIFLPAAGYRNDTWLHYAGSYGYYWSRSLSTGNSYYAYYLNFGSSNISTGHYNRYYGQSVRPVCVNDVRTVDVSNIELNMTELSVKVGETRQLSATVLPENATYKEIIWASSNADVAAVINGLVVAIAPGTCTITCSATDGSGVKAECKVTVQNVSGSLNGHDYVDLGLPSGTLWATCNVGANSPEEYGDYFAWGESQPKRDYNWDTYKYGGEYSITKYCTDSYYGTVDNKTELEAVDDAATVNWGVEWQMPSIEQCEELINSSYTTIIWTTLNGTYGYMITSNSNGNSIFFPTAGWCQDTSLSYAGSCGFYWSRTLDYRIYNCAHIVAFDLNGIYAGGFNGRNYGQSVRPVRVKK